MKTPPLVVISFDGFANEYRKRKKVLSLEKMGECGARTKQMFPSYPSKTFPNHFTMATGVYPEQHGIVDNAVYDPKIDRNIQDVREYKGRKTYFRSEPIWSAAVRQKKRMHCLFYPGCSYNITGYNPTVDIKYGVKMSYHEQVKTIVDWLRLPTRRRPHLIMAYFNNPDATGHQKRTDQVNKELEHVDKTIDLLLTSFKRHRLLDCVN
ncbi:Ectonucleotide pyrophosphatase/phosphodiesterase C27A7.3 [Aphelenchoides fujianensis]|nr:Ectonucleotide pyrophosphatase/phosphodiesterase C27A7.3 [Aphelenchoides fujianensis]